ncbi:MAG: glycosyltransferase family 4 protein [Verrucomicrobia bacterium]|nr:glycosyltransferase family 4 protein [Verrucomicrobiota bacterium]
MRILHTESSKGWGGQEIRILREAEGMRKRGHEVFLAVNAGGGLVQRAKEAGFIVYELPFTKPSAFKTIYALVQICKAHNIDLINTHSSLDAWIGGIAARIAGKKVIRTRHLSTPIRKGLNSRLLYKSLADFVVTTSSPILSTIGKQAGLSPYRLQCIPTGIDPHNLKADLMKAAEFRASLGVGPSDILVGTACFVRSWKGIHDLLAAAAMLKDRKEIKWVVVGGGHVDDYRSKVPELGLEGIVTFTGHLEAPYSAIRAMDIFVLLSTAHEGVSQASLQAAYLERPLVTTTVGGLPEVCLDGITGFVVPPFSPEAVAKAVSRLADNPALRKQFGAQGRHLVEERFTLNHTLDEMEKVYNVIGTPLETAT